MRITILHPSLDVQGGAERQALMLAQGLEKRGHNVTIYVSKLDKEKCYPDLIDKVKIVECGGYGYRDIKKTIIFSSYYMKKMTKMVKECDVINCHNYPTIYAALKIKNRLNKPIVWMCNEPPFPPLYKGDKINYNLFSFFYRLVILPFLIYNKVVSKKIDKILVLDNMNYNRIKNTYNKESSIIHTGLDFNAAKAVKKDNRKYVVLSVGRIDKGKRTEDAIKAISILKDKIPNILLKIVGGGKMLESMKDLSHSLGLDKHIVFYGKVDDKTLSGLYASCNILLFTAENQSWGLVPLEAMTYGTPCIVSIGAGVSDMLQHKVNCLKVKPRDVKGIVNNVLLLYKDKRLAEKIAKNGQAFVKKEFSWEKYVDEMEKVFLSLK